VTRSESQLVTACLEYLLVMGIPAWRNNSGATMIGKRFIRFGMKGSSDILGVLPPTGRFLAVECKQPKGRTTESQDEFLDAINEAGGLGVVVRSVDELESMITKGHC
jgi:hypothetical protein